MTCANVLPMFSARSMPTPVMPVDLALGLCLSPPLCHFLGVLSPKPLRSCIHLRVSQVPPLSSFAPAPRAPGRATPMGPSGGEGGTALKKRVVFADSKGLSLTAVRLFSERGEECPPPAEPLPGPWKLIATRGGGGMTSPAPGSRLRLGFPLPSADFRAFRARLREGMVLLESCSATRRSLQGTVRVRNTSYQKAVHVRVTFDSWRSHRDVPCAYLRQQHGEPDTDVFEFDIALPECIDPKERIEFCVSYLPGGYSSPVWDNNNGQNYRLHVSDTPGAAPAPNMPLSAGGRAGRL